MQNTNYNFEIYIYHLFMAKIKLPQKNTKNKLKDELCNDNRYPKT